MSIFQKSLAFFGFTIFLLPILPSHADDEACNHRSQFTFSWQFGEECSMRPRGGTASGPEVILDSQVHQGWLAVQEEGLSAFEQDRAAILAMAGPYRTSFDFLEVAGYTVEYEPSQPYQSWATEYVYVLEDTGEFISLQHVIVMFFQEGEEVSGPMVMKHWRQDWQYEKADVLAYVGNQTWERQPVPANEVAGSWSQAVYQVDDSPRYESWGQWDHHPNFSAWESATTWRPLPRRESSVRDDYQVLEGKNRHSILPNGWLHEETNYKLVIDEQGNRASSPYLAKELGVNRYELIVDHDFSEGDLYIQKTGLYWQTVRAVWRAIIAENEMLKLHTTVESMPLFMSLFETAEQLKNADDAVEIDQQSVRSTIEEYVY